VNPFSRNWLKYKRNSDEARIKPANPAWRNLAEPRTQGEQYFGAHILAGIAVFLLRNIIDKVSCGAIRQPTLLRNGSDLV
jgi:hypothetical protein